MQRLEFYSKNDLCAIVNRTANIFNLNIDNKGASEIASRARGTPRIAIRLLKRVRDYAEVKANSVVNKDVANDAMDLLEVDPFGLDSMDRKLILTIIEKFSGGPVGIENLASAIGEEKGTLEDVVEPFLIQEGFIQRTSRGRILSKKGLNHIE